MFVKTLTDFSVFPPIRSLLNEGELIRTKKSCKSKLRKSVKVEQAIKSVKAKEDIMNARTGNTKLFHQPLSVLYGPFWCLLMLF
jgi:hypothetical protein